MLTELRSSLRPAFVLLLLFTLLTGVAYPLAITGIAQVAFPAQANGSLIRKCHLRDAGDRQRISHPGQQGEQQQQHEGGAEG